MGLVVPVSFGSSFESRTCWVCESPSCVSLRVAPVCAIVSTSIRSVLQPGPESEPILDKRDAEPSSASVLGSMCCMQQESQQETNKLEGYRDEHIPQEGKERSSRESLYNHFSGDRGGGNSGREVNSSSLPIWWNSVSLSGSVGWWCVLLGFLGR